jgi:PAS domain S-box-containing protein
MHIDDNQQKPLALNLASPSDQNNDHNNDVNNPSGAALSNAGGDGFDMARMEQAFPLISEVLPGVIWNSLHFSCIASDANGLITLVNPGAEKMLGYSAPELVKLLSLTDLSDPQELILRAETLSLECGTTIARGFDALVYKARRGIEDSYAMLEIRKNGKRIPVMLTVTALRNAQNILVGYLFISTDNTRDGLVEESPKKENLLRSAIYTSTSFSGIVCDIHGMIQIFNAGAEKMLGYSSAEVASRLPYVDFFDPLELRSRAEALSVDYNTMVTPDFEALIVNARNGIEENFALTTSCKDGNHLSVLLSVTTLCDEQNTVIGYLFVGTDNTRRKMAEDALKKANFLQSTIFNSVRFSSITTDTNGIIQIFNAGAEKMLGYSAHEVVNRLSYVDISDPQELIARAAALSLEFGTVIKPGFEAQVYRAKRGIEDSYATTKVHKNCRKIPVMLSISAVHDEKNTIIGYSFIGTDNSLRKKLEVNAMQLTDNERAAKKAHEARSRLESVGVMAAGIAHDFNSILGTINGYSELLLDEVSDQPSLKESVEEILKASMRARDLIKRLMAFARQMSPELVLTDAVVATVTILKMLEVSTPQEVKVQFSSEILTAPVLAESNQIEQIVMNLYNNAIDAIHGNGWLDISIKRIHNLALTEGSRPGFSITVEDNGDGISTETQQRIFDPFFTTKGIGKGSGLGLSVVFGIVAELGGDIQLHSMLGMGSKFTVRLPLTSIMPTPDSTHSD